MLLLDSLNEEAEAMERVQHGEGDAPSDRSNGSVGAPRELDLSTGDPHENIKAFKEALHLD